MSIKYLLREVYWVVILLISSYLIIALNSSFNLNEPMPLCKEGAIHFPKIWVIIQLSILLTLTRQLFYFILKVESQTMRYFLLPIVLFALPVSVIVVWLQWMGC